MSSYINQCHPVWPSPQPGHTPTTLGFATTGSCSCMNTPWWMRNPRVLQKWPALGTGTLPSFPKSVGSHQILNTHNLIFWIIFLPHVICCSSFPGKLELLYSGNISYIRNSLLFLSSALHVRALLKSSWENECFYEIERWERIEKYPSILFTRYATWPLCPFLNLQEASILRVKKSFTKNFSCLWRSSGTLWD